MLFKSYINVFLGQLEKRRCLALSGDSVSPTQAIEISQDIPLNLNNK